LSFENFRCFDRHTVNFEKNTVIVGKNNAGKSSIVEGLRLIAALVNRKSATFVAPPSSLDLPDFEACVQVGSADLDLEIGTIFHRYGEPPAVIAATFEGDITATVYISSPNAVFASRLRQLDLPSIYVLPQISPLRTEEYVKSDLYVAEHLFSDLSSRQSVFVRAATGRLSSKS
jgi:hypothetical protein